MNDFDDIIGGAVGARADCAPLDRPDFGDMLGARQQQLRRRSTIGALGVLAIGVTGMAAFAVGGPTESTADGPDNPLGSDEVFVTTTMPGFPVAATVPVEAVWYCEGPLDRNVAFPATTTIAPPTTIARPVDTDPNDSGPFPDASSGTSIEDSGYFRTCMLVDDGSGGPLDEGVTVTTYTERFPATTTTSILDGNIVGATEPTATDVTVSTGATFGSQPYVVRTGDYAIALADQFCVPLQELVDFNGWNSGNEFPFPGDVIKIPPGGCTESPSAPCTTPGCDAAAVHIVQPGDYPIKVADDYCVALEDMIALNDWESANEMPFPGERILIPPPVTSGACPVNGES